MKITGTAIFRAEKCRPISMLKARKIGTTRAPSEAAVHEKMQGAEGAPVFAGAP